MGLRGRSPREAMSARLIGRLSVLVGVIAFVVVASATHAGASTASVIEVGWWTSEPGASPAPAGGFQVANGVQGPQSIAAIRMMKESDPGAVKLQLTPASGAVNADAGAALQICPIVADWKAANPGAAGDAPKYDCATKVDVTKDAGGTWSADVSALLSSAAEGAPVSMMVVPAPSAVGSVPVPFQINFSAAAVAAPAGTPAGAAQGSSPFSAPQPSSAPSVAGARPSITPSTPHPVTAPAPAAPTNTTAPPSTAPANQQASAPTVHIATAGRGRGKPWGRLLYLVPLSAIGGLAVALGRKVVSERGLVGEPA